MGEIFFISSATQLFKAPTDRYCLLTAQVKNVLCLKRVCWPSICVCLFLKGNEMSWIGCIVLAHLLLSKKTKCLLIALLQSNDRHAYVFLSNFVRFLRGRPVMTSHYFGQKFTPSPPCHISSQVFKPPSNITSQFASPLPPLHLQLQISIYFVSA